MKLKKKAKYTKEAKVTVSNRVLLKTSGEEQIKIKDMLTFDNPAYVNAKRFSRYASISIPRYLTYYEVSKGGISVPVGFDYVRFINDDDIVLDNRITNAVTYPKFMLTLRDTQVEATDAYLKLNKEKGSAKGMIKMPTGKGKSIVGIYLAQALKQKTLVIMHKTDLIRGWKKDIELCFDGKVKCGIIGNGKKEVGEQITLATVQTLNRYLEQDLKALTDEFGFVIIDECHHCPSSSYDLINEFKSRYKLGLTATPERSDGLAALMTLFLGDFCFECSADAQDGDILPVDVNIRKPDAYFNPVYSVRKGARNQKVYSVVNYNADRNYKLNDGEIRFTSIPYKSRPKISYMDIETQVLFQKDFVKTVVQDVKECVDKGKSCIMFFRQKEHCVAYLNILKRNGIDEDTLQIYNGDCTKSELETALTRAENKDALVTLTTYSKSTEGTNVKAWEVAFLVGSLNNGKSVEQAVGRVRRIADGKAQRATVYDYNLSDVAILSGHIKTRIKRYQKLGFRFMNNSQNRQKLFGRGYL